MTSNNRTRESQTQHSGTCNSNNSTWVKVESAKADATVQTERLWGKDAGVQCDGTVGSAGEGAETEMIKEMHRALDVAKGDYRDLEYELEKAHGEIRNLQWILEQHEEVGNAEGHHTAEGLSSNPSCNSANRENLYAGYDQYLEKLTDGRK